MSRLQGNALLRSWCRLVLGNVLSVGSGNDRDREGGRYRDYFRAAASYTTSDVRPGCDLVLDVRNMEAIVAPTFDAVFCHSVLEHVDDPFAAARELGRILAPGGVLILGVPFQYRLHSVPDFWRFTEFGVRHMLAEVARLTVEDLVGVDGAPNHAAVYWARARKP